MKTSVSFDYTILSFKTPKAFEKWLAKNHHKCNGFWLRYFKKDSEEKSITYKEAVDEALCFGWIDGQSKPYDETSWLQKFTPRREKSIWSKRNTENITRLTALGKMQPAGLAEVEKAKADGRWERAYDAQSAMQIPDDFLKELYKNKKAKTFFDSLNKANKFAIAFRLQNAKKAETREKWKLRILEMLANSEKFH